MEVDPQALRLIAGAVSEAADRLRQAYRARSARLAPMDGLATGWSAAERARSAATGWDGLVRRLSAAISSFASDLMTAAAGYEAADEQAAAIIASTARGARVVGA